MSRSIAGSNLAVLAAAFLCACGTKETPITEVKGDCGDAYQAQVCTYATVKGDSVIDVGATIPLASIENAPAEGGMEEWPPVALLKLPVPASVQQQSGLTELTMYWEPTGHPPGPYLTPHFDFHFYLIQPAQLDAIDCTDTSKPAALPAAYSLVDVQLPPEMAQMTGVPTLVGLCVPKMGMHSLPTAELQSDQPFRGDMVIGYYAAHPIFVEPMITKAMLMEKQSFDLPIPAVPGMSGPHPTSFRADYDAEQQVYRFAFSGFSS